MNQQTPTPTPSAPVPTPAAPNIDENILGGTQGDIDQQLSNSVKDLVNNTPEGENEPDGNPSGEPSSEPNSDSYKPAEAFMNILNKEVAASEDFNNPESLPSAQEPNTVPDLSLIRDLVRDHPHMAPAIQDALKAKGLSLDGGADPETLQHLEGMNSKIDDLTDVIMGDRQRSADKSQFESLDEMYLDVTKGTPDYGVQLTNFFNNSLLSSYELKDINRETFEESHKAISSELDNYFNARAKAEGFTKTGVPHALDNLGGLTPPGSQKVDQNKPVTMADADKELSQGMKNIFNNS